MGNSSHTRWGRFTLQTLLWTTIGIWVAGPSLGQLVKETDPQKMWAFIVGISNYTHAEPLHFASADAQAFADFLKSPRGGGMPTDHIALLLEERATRTGIEYELEQYWDKVQPGDTVYVYIAGHGFVHRRRIGYFLPIDGDPTSPNSTAINLLALQQGVFFGFEIANTLVMVSDMCHSGILANQQNAINQLLLSTFGEADEGKTFLNLVASGHDEPSWEDERLGHGIFTYTLLEALNGQGLELETPLVNANQAVDYVRREVPQRTANQQNPTTNEGFDPNLPLAFLDRPGPAPPSPEEATILRLLHGSQSEYLRAQWIDPNSQAIAVAPIPREAEEVAIGPLAPGPLELILYDAENNPRKVSLNLSPGENQLDFENAQVGELRLEPRDPKRLVAALAPARLSPTMQGVPTRSAASPLLESPSLILQLQPGTQVYVNEALYASVQDDSRPLQLRGLSRDPLILRLVYSEEHEGRFRLKLVPGPQWFDPETRELRPIRRLDPPPAFSPAPAQFSGAQADLYRQFEQALWEERLIEPEGDSAWDYYNLLQPDLDPEFTQELRGRLVVAMGNQAQRIILKYLSGRDIKWRAEDFEKGAALTARLMDLFKESTAYRSQQAFFDGRALLERRQYTAARDRLQETIQLEPEASHALNAIGLALWQEGRLEQALLPLDQAIELTPFWNYPRITRSLVLLQLRRYQEAETGLQGALENNPEDSTAHHGLGQLYFVTGRWREAEPELLRAIEFDPGNAYAYHTLGQLQLRLQRFGEAEQSLRLAIRLEPDEPAFKLTLISMLRQLGRVGEAGAVLADLIEREPDNPRVLEAYADFLASQDRHPEAEATFRRALEVAPRDSNLRVAYGIYLRGRNRRNDAVGQFRRALKIDPENAFAHYQLAEVFFADQKIDQAEKAARRATQADPRYSPPYRLLGQIAYARRDHDQALELFRKARDLATEAHQKQELQEAVAQIEAAIVQEQVAEVAELEQGGRLVQAWKLLSLTLSRAPESRDLRNRILAFTVRHPEAAQPADLPDSTLKYVLASSFWKAQADADALWTQGSRAQAVERFEKAFEQLDGVDLSALGSTEFNFENEDHGLHAILFKWGLRALELGSYQRVLDWMEWARRRWIYAPVPNYTPITVDSLMRPPDNPSPQRFEDCEVAHHPDSRAHRLLGAAWAGLGEAGKAGSYLEALEFRSPDLEARYLIARTLHQTGQFEAAELMLTPAIENSSSGSSERRAAAWALLARIQCDAGRCDQARQTIRRGLQELPGNRLLRQTLSEFN